MAKKKRPSPDRGQGGKPTVADIIKLVRRKAQHFLDTKGVTSVGVGYYVNKETGKETKELCIQFTVEEKAGIENLEEKGLVKLPDSIEIEDENEDENQKVKVQVIERSYEPHVVILDESTQPQGAELKLRRRGRQDPIRPGISISHEDGTAGTLGAIVYDKQTGQPYILSNWHVLRGDTGRTGDRILQPGPFDGGNPGKDLVGRLVRSHLGLAGDCAVSSIDDRSIDGTVLQLDVVPSPVIGMAELGDKVIKSGRTTGVTRGIVKRVGIVADISYSGVGHKKIGAFEIHPDPQKYPAENEEISKGGDSGSVWMIAEGEHKNVVVGLHFAGETDPDPNAEHALACNIHSVIEKLHVTFNPTSEFKSDADGAFLRRSIDIGAGLPVDDPKAEEEELDLNLENVAEIQRRLVSQPRETLAYFRQYVDEKLTENQLNAGLETLRSALGNPQAAERLLIASDTLEAVGESLPEDFTFPGIDLKRYPIDPGRSKFEPVNDMLRWIWFAAISFLSGTKKAQFRWHDAFPSRFCYKMKYPVSETPFKIALFSDWGTGEYQSNYISAQLETKQFPLGIHLGDVYYAGRKEEFNKYVREPLQNVVKETPLFFLNANHEMMSGAKWYYKYIDDKRNQHKLQLQEGSYFAIKVNGFQIIGIDTDYHEHGRLQERKLLEWLKERLKDGRKSDRTNILLSSNHPYEYGKKGITSLLGNDLNDLISRQFVDLWFWGNTHYCALFNCGKSTPFLGSCIGHGGFPYGREKHGKKTPAPVEFLETNARFPEATGLQQGRGNNGYCVMSLNSDGTIGLQYVDWMSNTRAVADLIRDSAGRLEINTVNQF